MERTPSEYDPASVIQNSGEARPYGETTVLETFQFPCLPSRVLSYIQANPTDSTIYLISHHFLKSELCPGGSVSKFQFIDWKSSKFRLESKKLKRTTCKIEKTTKIIELKTKNRLKN